MLILLYLISSIAGTFLVYFYKTRDGSEITFFSVSMHLIYIFLLFYPVIRYGNKVKIEMLSNSFINKITNVIVFFSMISLVVSAPLIIDVLSNPSFHIARQMALTGELQERHNAGFFSYFAVIGNAFSFFSLYLFFYFINFSNRKFIPVLLFISSWASMISNLAGAGRYGIFMFIYQVIFCVIFFKDTLKRKVSGKTYFIIGIVMAVLFMVAMNITLDRFSGGDFSPFFYLLDYMGQSFVNFSTFFYAFFDGITNGRLGFSAFFPAEMRIMSSNLNETIHADFYLNVFPTFAGSFIIDFGCYGTLLLSFVLFLFETLLLRTNILKFRIVKFVVFLIIYNLLFMGVFYNFSSQPTIVYSNIIVVIITFISCIKYRIHDKNFDNHSCL